MTARPNLPAPTAVLLDREARRARHADGLNPIQVCGLPVPYAADRAVYDQEIHQRIVGQESSESTGRRKERSEWTSRLCRLDEPNPLSEE